MHYAASWQILRIGFYQGFHVAVKANIKLIQPIFDQEGTQHYSYHKGNDHSCGDWAPCHMERLSLVPLARAMTSTEFQKTLETSLVACFDMDLKSYLIDSVL